MIASDGQPGQKTERAPIRGSSAPPSTPEVHGKRLRHRFSAQDGAFFYFDQDPAPSNVGVVGIIEGALPYESLIALIESKLHIVPRYRQRAVAPPFNAGRPTWEFDPNFDIRRHIMRVRLDQPGTEQQLLELAGRLYSGRLDRNKPLWEAYVVEGMEGGRTGIVCKVHHSMVDGVGGIELLMISLDVSPEAPPPPPPAPFTPPPVPGPVELLAEAVLDNIEEGIDRWASFGKGLAELFLGGDISTARLMRKTAEVAVPYFVVPMEPAPFNAPFSGDRKIATLDVSFNEAREVRKKCGGTINDVVLAVLGGALRRYLEMHGESTKDRDLRIVTPVNVRRQDERGTLGNRISLLAVEVPVGQDDPVACLHIVSERMNRLKQDRIAEGVEMGANLLFGLPAPLLKVATSIPMGQNRTAHMVCTNVPGPMIPLYIAGHQLLAAYPLLPIMWEMGFGCAVMSYDQHLYFTLLADTGAAQDVDKLRDFLQESWISLRSAAGVEAQAPDYLRPARSSVAVA